MSDNVMYDSPTELLHAAAATDRCEVQSVIPNGDGTYRCACSCRRWEVIETSREAGLRAARHHTSSIGETS
jgi:hypothetical protein